MNVLVCPADVVSAPVEVAWRTLTEDYASWLDGEIRSAQPPGPMVTGQVIELVTRELGLGFRVRLRVLNVDAGRRHAGIDVDLPFGVVNHELVTMDPTPEGGTLVRFN
ncbi:MAG TPA: hypothetical protein VF160_01920 [Candidatus Dormibacteraeota bacterium]